MSLIENQNSNHSDFRIFIPGFFDDYPLESEEFRLYAHIQRRAGAISNSQLPIRNSQLLTHN